ncbi:TPA: CapA family protein [Neisseria meningitidis]
MCNPPKYAMHSERPPHTGNTGFDYLSFANNHSNDFGAQGITATAASGSSFTYSIALKPLPITRPKLRKIPPSPR